ncbi:MAG: methyltransferase domain-containing protein [Pirellulales bacterium]|nr:methyltransferase domain-containing protein [Pirellulales bacterium]
MTVAPLLDEVSAALLERYAKLIYKKIGVVISTEKTTLLSNRLRRRLRATDTSNFDEYYNKLQAMPPEDPEWEHFLQEITTHETYLFRDQPHWDWVQNDFTRELVQQFKAGKRPPFLRVWSAACSTGDEAATIACCLAEGLPLAEWTVEIIGTDIGAAAIAQAQRQTFSERSMRLVPKHVRNKHFDQSPDAPTWTTKPALRKRLSFSTHNLLDPLLLPAFDLIVLKNVLIYFDTNSKARVMKNICQALAPGGYLITGAAEGVSELLGTFSSKQGWLHRIAKQIT